MSDEEKILELIKTNGGLIKKRLLWYLYFNEASKTKYWYENIKESYY